MVKAIKITKKMKTVFDITFWASVVTILSIFFALYVFISDKCAQETKEKQEYLNKLDSLKFELQKNNDVILSFFNKDKQAYLDGEKVAYFRYSTSVTNNLIAEGAILNIILLRNLDAIADNENQVNRILDIIALMADTSQIGSAEEKQMFENRIKTAYATIVNLNGKIEKYLPRVISDLKNHTGETKSKKTHWFCFNKCNSNELSPEMFK